MKAPTVLLFITLILGVVSLFVGEAHLVGAWVPLAVALVDYAILGLIVAENILDYVREPLKRGYVRRNAGGLSFAFAFVALFSAAQLASSFGGYGLAVLILRNLFLLLKIFTRIRRLSSFLVSLTVHPAQTILLSFLVVILVGCLVLMMPFCTVDGNGLPFLSALFTSTSAVCVTGLVVVDTATALTVVGQIVVLLLIQIGGLGIMLLSFFTLFALRQRLSLENKLLISYMLSEDDMSTLVRSVKSIVKITALVEGAGAVLLFAAFLPKFGFTTRTLFYAVFHSVSAFCNAGFALFSNSLESFRSNVAINLIVAVLIIIGGISFGVVLNLTDRVRGRVQHLSLNTRIVLSVTAVLLVAGTFLVYGAEHNQVMKGYSLGDQYLAAFFQSVSLRTAGFNTIPFGSFRTFTYLVMMVFMFVGAASGSTAGGIKVNTLAVLVAYVVSALRNRRKVTIMRHSIGNDQVLRAFLILTFGIVVVLIAFIVLSLTERLPFRFVAFEAVSAFGTVGLSAGITAQLSAAGRVVIIVLMFLGRLGSLTVLTAASQRESPIRVEYPQGTISMG
jgi:trk system potassium uptake protein TrkH